MKLKLVTAVTLLTLSLVGCSAASGPVTVQTAGGDQSDPLCAKASFEISQIEQLAIEGTDSQINVIQGANLASALASAGVAYEDTADGKLVYSDVYAKFAETFSSCLTAPALELLSNNVDYMVSIGK